LIEKDGLETLDVVHPLRVDRLRALCGTGNGQSEDDFSDKGHSFEGVQDTFHLDLRRSYFDNRYKFREDTHRRYVQILQCMVQLDAEDVRTLIG
jgi:hypothetical protein